MATNLKNCYDGFGVQVDYYNLIGKRVQPLCILLNPYNPKILCVFKIRYEIVFVCLLDEISMKQHSCLGCALIVKSMDHVSAQKVLIMPRCYKLYVKYGNNYSIVITSLGILFI